MLPRPVSTTIESLEQDNDPAKAYLSYTTDETGEYGMISANKEGLRLYAATLLRIADLMEKKKDGSPIYFEPEEWKVSMTGYDLIAGVIPRFRDRTDIVGETPAAPALSVAKGQKLPGNGCFTQVLGWLILSLILFASLKGFANLRSWVNIH